MAGGWTRDGAIQTQIDDTVSDAIAVARRRLAMGEALMQCVECGEDIPEPRRLAMPGVTRCIQCQSEREAVR
jgi:phage/conjugal plasmid C-4 type zinc finger TraR family protein